MSNMEPEQQRNFEDVVHRNVSSTMQHGNETRKLLREMEDKVTRLENNVQTLTVLMEGFRTQLGMIQQKLYVGGTSGD